MTEVEKLVARAQQGDGQAVEEILTLYRDKVYSLAFGLAGNHADAEDLAQEIFLKVYAALPTFVNDGRSFDAWVHRVGINLWIDWQRRRKKVQVFSLDSVVSTEDGEVDWEPASVGGNPEEELKKKEFWETVWRALGELSKGCRTALLLRALNEWSYREIATALNWSEAATKSRISRCRQRLKQKLVRAGFHFGRQGAGKEGQAEWNAAKYAHCFLPIWITSLGLRSGAK